MASFPGIIEKIEAPIIKWLIPLLIILIILIVVQWIRSINQNTPQITVVRGPGR